MTVDSSLPVSCSASLQEFQAAPSLGALDILPKEVMVAILAMVDQPAVASKVCRGMRALVPYAIEEKNVGKGISASALSSIVKTAVHPGSLSLLGRFQPEIFTRAFKEPKVVQAQLNEMLGGRLDLLSDPNALHRFISVTILRNSIDVAVYYYGREILQAPLPVEPVQQEPFFKRCARTINKIFGKSVPQPSAERVDKKDSRFRTISSVEEVLSIIRGLQPRRVMPVMVVQGRDDIPSRMPGVPIRSLYFPPRQVYSHLSENLQGLVIENASTIPQGIRELKQLMMLRLSNCAVSELPSEIGSLPALKRIWVQDCWDLERLPHNLTDIQSLEFIGIKGCPKLKQDHPFIQMLLAKNIKIAWE
jgi:hypothetical protein